MSEAVKFLEDVAGYTEKEVPEWFIISDCGKEWEIKAFRWLDGVVLGDIRRGIAEKGGTYRQDEKTRYAIFTLPKEHIEQADTTSNPDTETDQIEYVPLASLAPSQFRIRLKPETEISDLVESIKTYGILEPIIVRRKGELYEIVAGERRWKAAKTANLIEVPIIVKSYSDVDARSIQLIENLQRKDLSPEEKSVALAEYAKFTGYNGKQIAQSLGMSYSWVMIYLPKDFKDKEMAELGKLSAESKKKQDLDVATSLVTNKPSQDTIQEPKLNGKQVYQKYLLGMRECEKCGKEAERKEMHFIDNLLICPECAGKDKPPPKQPEKAPVKTYKETGDFRKAAMQPQVSKQEIAVLEELQKRGHKVESQIHFCLAETVLDFIVDGVPFYLDGKYVHLNRDWKDDLIREKLSRKLGRTVFGIEYERFSKKSTKEIVDSMEETLKW